MAQATTHPIIGYAGAGPRTIVLESGFGDTLDIWQTIQPRVAANRARTLSYNRAGYIGSDPAVAARDAASIVAELRGELRQSRRGRRCDPGSGGLRPSLGRPVAAAHGRSELILRGAAPRGNIPPARHMRNPPTNAKSLLPRRAPVGIFLSLRALPPPRTT